MSILVTRGFLDTTGVPAANRLIDVFFRSDGSTRPTLFDESNTILSNPLATDELGNLIFYINAGEYEFSVGGYQIPFDVVDPGGAIVVPPIIHSQISPSATWTVHHNRQTKPNVVLQCDDDGDDLVLTDVSYPDDATVVIEWPSPVTGKAYIQ